MIVMYGGSPFWPEDGTVVPKPRYDPNELANLSAGLYNAELEIASLKKQVAELERKLEASPERVANAVLEAIAKMQAGPDKPKKRTKTKKTKK